MPLLVSQYQLAPFTRPSQNERPITSSIVRGLGNTVAAAFNQHDADASIHVQSGLLADRPAAGILGRVFVTYDTASQPLLWLDNGVSWVSQSFAWESLSGRPATFPPSAHSAVLLTSGTLDVARFPSSVVLANQSNGFTQEQVFVEGLRAGPSANAGVQTGFLGLYSVTATPTVRSGAVGFLGLSSAMTVQNDRNGDILLSTASTLLALRASGRLDTPRTLQIGGVNYTFPAADGTTGQALRTDGAGNLAWATVSGSGGGGTVAWVDVTGRPLVFPPDAHTHPATQITAGALGAGVTLPATQITPGAIPSSVTLPYNQLTGVPSSFTPAAHNQAWSTITGVPAFLPADWNTTVANRPSTFAPSSHRHPWSDLDNVPATFAPSAHTHLWAHITDRPDSFTPSAHSHVIADVTGLASALSTKTTQGGTGTFSDGTVGGNPLPGIIVSTSAPSGSAIAGTIWARV
jgi:hypothetical protein